MTRIVCSRCQESVYNILIEGPDGSTQRVPLVIRINVGQPPDTGGTFDLNGKNLRVPSFVRAMMLTPIARLELCVKCFSEVFGVPCVTATEDPMYDTKAEAAQRVFNDAYHDERVPLAERANLIHARALLSFGIAWGDTTIDSIPDSLRTKEGAAEMVEGIGTTAPDAAPDAALAAP